jgi:CRP-like cAMP-binding protein
MTDKLINNILKYGALSQGEKDAIIQSVEIKEFKKGDFLLKEGQKSLTSYFILKGCIRQYFLLNGNEMTTRFFTEDDWVISVEVNSENSISTHNWIAMEDCIVITGNAQKGQKLFDEFPRLETISRRMVESAFIEIQESVIFYNSKTPEERYLSLINRYPSILKRVPQYHIASYIGVKPESLSRIRKRVATKLKHG